VKAYKIELLVIDFDGLGQQGVVETIASRRWPNDCISPSVEACQEADIGVWTDDHPLNKKATASAEYARLFAPAPQAAHSDTERLAELARGLEIGAPLLTTSPGFLFLLGKDIATQAKAGRDATSSVPAVVQMTDLSKAILAIPDGSLFDPDVDYNSWEKGLYYRGFRDARGAAATLAKQVPAQEQSIPNTADERAAFEAWHAEWWGKPFRLGQTDQYKMDSSQGKWLAWQARAALVVAEASQPPTDAKYGAALAIVEAVRRDGDPAFAHLLQDFDAAKPVQQGCTCPSGDGSLRWPCPKHPPQAEPKNSLALAKSAFRQKFQDPSMELPGDEYDDLEARRRIEWNAYWTAWKDCAAQLAQSADKAEGDHG